MNIANNMNSEHNQDAGLRHCFALLRADGVHVSEKAQQLLWQYLDHLRAWNARMSLVSEGDSGKLASVHLPDALSLSRYVALTCAGERLRLLDIGSGGGFPAIPLAVLFPNLPMTLIERSAKKVGFLRYVLAQLGLRHVELLHGEFPTVSPQDSVGAITARAVEQPARLYRGLADLILGGACYLCQSGRAGDFPAEMFHVEHIHDAWTESGMRRGSLSLVRANSTCPKR